eukprot:CAMPEP_0194130004 /NCGR_PEP_ID=MMETSP0152-20130528/1179_1 /TAXON_ID=1049557 /ORGANISM="Thalassiothrix antarctica, Strain L6-D1" /LENGTH=570 /DNA_ID=CAMNT_0038824409 /DNA_START=71 /DNA_END=1780 /DNA_ORIENTATION=+
MFLSRSRSLTLFVVYLVLIQALRLDASFLSSDNEKVFRNNVSLYTKGDTNLALNEKTMLEESFRMAYNELIVFPLCSFRSLEGVDLVRLEIDNADEAFFFLDYEVTLRCFDCVDEIFKFFNDDEYDDNDESWTLEEDSATCFWSGYHDDTMEDVVAERSVTNVAPSMENFVKMLNEIIVASQKMSNSIEEIRRVVSVNTVFESEEPIPCPCNPNSYCTYSNFERIAFWKIPETDDLYYNCTCGDGFSGEDGWRCDQIDECEDPDNWPCAPPEEGGFCVDYHPDNSEYQKFKCGCRSGFVANEMHPPDKRHGITHCLEIDNNVEEEEDTEEIADGVATEEEEADDNNTCDGKICNEETQYCNGKKCQCKIGFFSPSGVGGRCFDVKECTTGQDTCHRNADCIEQIGSYTCSCKDGYTGNPFENCMDINECELGKDDCNATAMEICINTRGSFNCALPTPIPTREPTRNPTRKPTIPSERDILVSFYHATNGDNWRENTWLTLPDHCDWYEVVCNADGKVIALKLSDKNIDGTLPKELGQLSMLVILDLESNKLKGKMPNTLGQLTDLEELW